MSTTPDIYAHVLPVLMADAADKFLNWVHRIKLLMLWKIPSRSQSNGIKTTSIKYMGFPRLVMQEF